MIAERCPQELRRRGLRLFRTAISLEYNPFGAAGRSRSLWVLKHADRSAERAFKLGDSVLYHSLQGLASRQAERAGSELCTSGPLSARGISNCNREDLGKRWPT